MILQRYLNFLYEQQFGVQPQVPVQNPRGRYRKSITRMQPKVPHAPLNPVAPNVTKRKQVPRKKLNPVERQSQEDLVMQSLRFK